MKQTLPDSKSADILVLDFPVYKTVKNKFALFKPPGVSYFIIAAWMNLDHRLA